MLNERLTNIKHQIVQHSAHPDDVTLLVVSKTHSVEKISNAFTLGLTHFGENYLQEALDKISQLEQLDITWHFIGPIQSKKARQIATHFDWVQSLDRLKVAEKLSEHCPKHKELNVLIQVNIDHDPQKSGILAEHLDEFISQVQNLPRLKLRGLMCIPSQKPDPEQNRASFTTMYQLYQQYAEKFPEFDTLSMGMSADFSIALEEGANLIRIGSALLGERP